MSYVYESEKVAESISLEILKLSKEIVLDYFNRSRVVGNPSEEERQSVYRLIAETAVALTETYKDNVTSLKETTRPQPHFQPHWSVLGDK